MLIVSWNMGCGPPTKYRRSHADAWRYLLDELKPDVAFVQEALFAAPLAEAFGQVFWSEDHGRDGGTAVLVRQGLAATRIAVTVPGSYVAGAELIIADVPTLFLSVHVGPPNYRKHLRGLADALTPLLDGRRFVVGGDLNAARHLDDVYGGKWFTRYFEDLAVRQFHDCHWAQHGKEVQSFWGHQAREAYQCDHVFTDSTTAQGVSACAVIDNPDVRALSDHGPLELTIRAALPEVTAVVTSGDPTGDQRQVP